MAPPQWAYQVENYVTQPDEELVCSICRAVFCEPSLCSCDHVFCKTCITKWLQTNRNCPICRKRTSLSSIKQAVPIVKNLIMKLMLNCRNKTLGCTAQFSVESSEAHVKECGYELVQCRNKPCTDKLFRKDVAEHETKDCPHRAIKCRKCKCKIPTSSGTVEHNCINALRLLLKERNGMVIAKTKRIKQLKAEIKNLKAKLKETDRSRMSSFSRRDSLNSDTLSSISPDEITINIHEFDTSSMSSDSDMSSDNFYIFTNESVRGEESDSSSVSMDNDDNAENEGARNASEYRNAESQTVEPSTLFQNDETQTASGIENSAEFDHPLADNDSEMLPQSMRPVKRRPTTQKPAKRRFPPETRDSKDADGHTLSSRPSNIWLPSNYGENSGEHTKAESRGVGPNLSKDFNTKHQPSNMEAGPSAASVRADNIEYLLSKKQSSNMEAGPSSAPDYPDHSTSKKRLHLKQKRAKQTGKYFKDNAVSSRIVTSDNPVFERTLALLEQHSLESDPEWLPDHARLRESDATESDSSYVVESSNSDFSDVDSLDNKSGSLDDSHHEIPAISDYMNWIFESTSEEDPDWRPPNSDDEDSL